MNNELQSWSDDIIYKHALTFSHEELAGMYSLCNKREQEYLKEIKALRLILQSHGEVVEMNAELKFELVGVTDRLRIKEEENARLRTTLEFSDEIFKENTASIQDLAEKYKTLKEENARLRGALEKCADWTNCYDDICLLRDMNSLVNHCENLRQRARKALERGE